MLIARRIPWVAAATLAGLALMALVLTASAAPAAKANTVRIWPGPSAPCNTSLQACINGSNAGDEIQIQAGSFITSVTLNKAVSLVGLGAVNSTIQALPGQRVITVTSAVTAGTQISNLTLRALGSGLASGNGGVAWIQTGAQPSLRDLVLQGGTVTSTGAVGGGLYTQASLVLTNVIFLGNTSNEDGGGLFGTGDLTLNGGAFTGNVSQAGRGGALSVGGNLVMDGTVISGSLSFDSGGGMLVNGTSTINNALIANNRTTGGSGGGLRAVGTAFINNTQFISNTSFNPGGGMRGSVGVFLTNTTFLTNAAGVGGGDSRGGGLFANAAASINEGLFQANTAGQGGGAQVEGALAVASATFRGNVAQTQGGGLRVITATLQNAAFEGNRVLVGNGGGLWASNFVVLSSSFFTANTVLSGTAASSTGNGGGAFSDGNLISTQNVFVGNFALRLGGGLDVDELNSFRDEFRGNITGPQGSGGGLFVSGPFGVGSALFFTNTANTAGGMGVNSGANGTIQNSLFARNVVTFADGGAALRLLSVNQVFLTHNTIVGTNQAGRGAVHMQSTGGFFFDGNLIANHARGLVQFGSAPTSTVSNDHNLFFSVTLPYLDAINPIIGKASDITGTAAFRDPANNDYHLSALSDAIDAAPSFGLSEDIEGDPRPLGNNFDIGFDEALPLLERLFVPLALRD